MDSSEKLLSAHSELSPTILKWIFRFLVPLQGYKDFVSATGFSNDLLANAIGMSHWINDNPDFDRTEARRELFEKYTAIEAQNIEIEFPEILQVNLERITHLLGLSPLERNILGCFILVRNERVFNEAADTVGRLSTNRVFYIFSVLLGVTEFDVRQAFAVHGPLVSSGLMSIDAENMYFFSHKIDLLSGSFADFMFSSIDDPIYLIRETVTLAPPHKLTIQHYEYMNKEVSLFIEYLRKVIEQKLKGVNILIFGVPGTGKTELVKTVAHDLSSELFLVANEDENGYPLTGEKRLRAYNAGQSFFAKRKAMILFDEIEDLMAISPHVGGEQNTAVTHKVWFNKILETNPIPTIWICNNIDEIDNAYKRRFDMILEIQVPPPSAMRGIIQQYADDILRPETISRLADTPNLAPALISRSAHVIRTIQEVYPTVEQKEEAYEQLLSNTLKAQGYQPVRIDDPNRLPAVYNPQYINTDYPLKDLPQLLRKNKSGRLCLYGPPGTGKTAFVRWIAKTLECPLVIKRGSDLLSKWVGESERNIAQAFKLAKMDDAILLIDEVDSFLQDRKGSKAHWEITMVNEMLTQIETFPGIFIATTNLLDRFDEAVFRRFDMKIAFNALKSEQSAELLSSYCKELGLAECQEAQHIVSTISNLTPGDFSLVARQARFVSISTALAFAEALQKECLLKSGQKSPMGFVY